VLCACALLLSATTSGLLAAHGLVLPPWTAHVWTGHARWALLAVVWSLAVHDAALTAVLRRRIL
jgi:hypothetical protein